MFEIVDSIGMRFSILNAVWAQRMIKHGLWESPRLSVLHHMHVYELSYTAGLVGTVGVSLFAAIEDHTIEA